MQPRDGSVSFFPAPQGSKGDPGDPDGERDGERDGDGDPGVRPDSIRERQRRRRNAGRPATDLTAILAQPDGEDEDEEEEAPPGGPPPARVFVVFRGMSWEDPQGGLRESDSILGVYASEESARRAVAAGQREGGEGAECWYQPYPVQD
jgi:hypothetical protein